MFKLTTLAFALAIASSSAFAQSARVPNPFKDYSEAQCAAAQDKGALWKEAERWQRESDGKVRNTRARCTFDAKGARAFIAKLIEDKRLAGN